MSLLRPPLDRTTLTAPGDIFPRGNAPESMHQAMLRPPLKVRWTSSWALDRRVAKWARSLEAPPAQIAATVFCSFSAALAQLSIATIKPTAKSAANTTPQAHGDGARMRYPRIAVAAANRP